MMQVEVFGAALISRLRPSTFRGAAGLLADDRFLPLGRRAEDKDTRLVGIEHDGRVAWVVFDEPGERVEVRDRTDEQRVLVDRRLEWNGFEETGPAAREDREGLTCGVVFLPEVLLNPRGVLVETLALG